MANTSAGTDEYLDLLWLDVKQFDLLGIDSVFWKPQNQWDQAMKALMFMPGDSGQR